MKHMSASPSSPHVPPVESGRHALVVGANKLIGSEICRHLARFGAKITLVVRHNLAAAQGIADEIQRNGGTAQVLATDVTNPEVFGAMLDKAEATFGPVDYLVNNAGAFHAGTLLDTTSEMWDDLFRVNAKGVFISATVTVRRNLSADHPLSIVNIAGASAERSFPGGSVYAQSKAAVISLTKQMALEWGPYGIRVNAVSPGPIRLADSAWQADEPELAREVARLPIRRAGTPYEVAAATAFLLGSEAGYITGQILAVDGGSLLTWYITRGDNNDQPHSEVPQI